MYSVHHVWCYVLLSSSMEILAWAGSSMTGLFVIFTSWAVNISRFSKTWSELMVTFTEISDTSEEKVSDSVWLMKSAGAGEE